MNGPRVPGRGIATVIPVALCSILATFLLVGCSTAPDTANSGSGVVSVGEDILLTLGPRAFLDFMETSMVEADPALEITDGTQFLQSAFPAGDGTLAQLLAPATRERVQRELAVDHVVLFGPVSFPDSSPVVPISLGDGTTLPFGVGRLETSSAISGVVIDLVHNSVVSEVGVTAARSPSFAAWVFMAGSFSDAEKAALRTLAVSLTTQLHTHEDTQPNRVALVAIEAAQLWQPAGTSSWTRVEGAGSEANPVYEVTGVCGLDGTQVSLQQAFDRAMGLYHAKAWDAAYDCFRFVRDAGSGSSTLPGEASQHMQSMEERSLVERLPR